MKGVLGGVSSGAKWRRRRTAMKVVNQIKTYQRHKLQLNSQLWLHENVLWDFLILILIFHAKLSFTCIKEEMKKCGLFRSKIKIWNFGVSLHCANISFWRLYVTLVVKCNRFIVLNCYFVWSLLLNKAKKPSNFFRNPLHSRRRFGNLWPTRVLQYPRWTRANDSERVQP